MSGLDTALHWRGYTILPSHLLPVEPTSADEARRIVRWGMRDVLEWLGEPVGEPPGTLIHMVAVGNRMLLVSRDLWADLYGDSLTSEIERIANGGLWRG